MLNVVLLMFFLASICGHYAQMQFTTGLSQEAMELPNNSNPIAIYARPSAIQNPVWLRNSQPTIVMQRGRLSTLTTAEPRNTFQSFLPKPLTASFHHHPLLPPFRRRTINSMPSGYFSGPSPPVKMVEEVEPEEIPPGHMPPRKGFMPQMGTYPGVTPQAWTTNQQPIIQYQRLTQPQQYRLLMQQQPWVQQLPWTQQQAWTPQQSRIQRPWAPWNLNRPWTQPVAQTPWNQPAPLTRAPPTVYAPLFNSYQYQYPTKYNPYKRTDTAPFIG